MRLSKNVQSRVVAVLVSLFLGFVMPWVLQANRDFRGEAQFKFDPSAMFASTVAEVTSQINRTLESCFCSQVPYL